MNVTLNSLPANENRSALLDQVRGIAIILMIIFHAAYDLNLFGYGVLDANYDYFWFGLPRLIVFLFLICVGVGLRIAYKFTIHWRKFWKRFLKLSGLAALVTISTYFLFPERWIYFGTLHCVALCSLLALPLLRFPRFAFFVAVLMLSFDYAGYRIPWIKFDHFSMDYIPIFPWIAVVWLGFYAHHLGLHQKKVPKIKFLEFLGKHSLLIYVIHQPFLFGLLTLIAKIREATV